MNDPMDGTPDGSVPLPTLQTERLVLRPWRAEDLEAFHAIWGDPEVIWWGANESLEVTRASFLRLLAAPKTWPTGIGWFAICLAKESGAGPVVGDVLLQPGKAMEGIEIGWHVRRNAWGKGYATEAAERVLRYACDDLKLPELFAIVATQNDRSLRIVEKLGMEAVRDMVYADLPHRLFVMRNAEVF